MMKNSGLNIIILISSLLASAVFSMETQVVKNEANQESTNKSVGLGYSCLLYTSDAADE